MPKAGETAEVQRRVHGWPGASRAYSPDSRLILASFHVAATPPPLPAGPAFFISVRSLLLLQALVSASFPSCGRLIASFPVPAPPSFPPFPGGQDHD